MNTVSADSDIVRNGRILTFYSYKGGTGRSMSLANIAWILAMNGHRVLMIDWDLEAPGLHRWFGPLLHGKRALWGLCVELVSLRQAR
jgi:Mrp family chromosome partitioning ATPase